ncbi:hypothetical protein FUA23_05745 [Neolewinella aurantiaca]|uniref:Uncharacterized protein n=1 Tax=Neolewinella aurantiaca TaxID=2602767 RepID=A0A5C7FHC7_9BACT|nr:hypothetical protein [Neolewinella aurantiaca]TXF90596.1 hypothetical protein FUA23_05745 [Neolewinella aurantiaca]
MDSTVEKNPLISIYQSLDKADVRRLGKWLDSPAHNKREDVRALHAYLSGGGDRLFKTSSLGKMRIWKRIFPGETYNDARLRQTFHWALKATESFLAWENWQNDPMNQQLGLAKELRRRNISGSAGRSLRKAEQLQEKTLVRNEAYYRNQYELELEREEHRTYYQLLDKPRFQQISDTLDITYLIEKLKASGNMLFHQRVYRTEYSVRFLDEVISYVEQLDLEDYPVLAIHYYGYRGLVEDDVSGTTISLLRDAVEKHGNLLSRVDLRYVILMAINLCISNMNQGREPYIRESFEWYRLGFSRQVITQDNLLTRATYLNVITIGLRLQEYDWIRRFIDSHTKQLEDDIRENTESFARARLAYEQKDYDTGMPLLAQVDFKHPVYNIMAKTLQLKIYYEIDEYDAMDSQLDSMTTYLRRKTLSDLHKDNFGNIVRFVRRMSRLKPGDRKKKAELREQIENASPLTEKKWLLEQLDKR